MKAAERLRSQIHREKQLALDALYLVDYQPRKVERSGISEAVGGHVLIYIHKEQALADVERRYPAERYVMVDDRLRILAATKKVSTDLMCAN